MHLLDWARANHDLLSIITIICLLINFGIFLRHRRSGRIVKGESLYIWRLCRSGDRDGVAVMISSVLIIAIAIFKIF